MRIRIYNAKILTMKDGFDIIDGEVHVENDKISYIGRQGISDMEDKEFDRQINGKDKLLMPGFKNAHTHSAMTFARSYADDMPLMDWLFKKIFPMEKNLKYEYVYEFSKIAILEYLTSGITANFDMYYFPEAIFEASNHMGFRTVVCGTSTDSIEKIEEMEYFYNKYNTDKYPLSSFQFGYHAEYTTDKEMLKLLSQVAHRNKAPIYSHNSETRGEVEECLKRHGMTPTEYADDLGLYDFGGGGFHCVYLTDRDMKIFKEKGLSVITNPAANLKLASGIAPIKDILKEGINIGIGTDGPAGNNALDMFREMFLVTGLAKVREDDAEAVDAYQVIKMATRGASKAMLLDDCDFLDIGKQADMIMLDLKQPNMQPIHNIVKNIVYSGSKSNVYMTMVAGKILYEDGNFFVGEDVDKIYERANKLVEELKK